MGYFIWPSIGAYFLLVLFSYFLWMRGDHFDVFRPALFMLLKRWGLLGLGVSVIYLACYGWQVSWLAVAAIWVMGTAFFFVFMFMLDLMPRILPTVASVVGLPVAAYYCFALLP